MEHLIEYAEKSTSRMSYTDALVYCLFHEYNGKRGWRLPTGAEYSKMRNNTDCWDTSDGDKLDNLMYNWYVIPVRTILDD